MSVRTKKWAQDKGLVYTGHSERVYGMLVGKLDELRKKGYTAYITRWEGGGGFSIHADKKWAWDEEEKRISAALSQMEARRLYVHEQLRKSLEALQAEEDELNRRIAELRVRQMGGPW